MCKAQRGLMKELAPKAQVTYQYFSKALKGTEPLSEKTIQNLSEATGIDFYGDALRSQMGSLPAPEPVGKEMVKAAMAEVLDERKVKPRDEQERRLLEIFADLDENGRETILNYAERIRTAKKNQLGGRSSSEG